MRIGIDLGGTKIEGIALANSGQELARLRVPTPRSYAETVHAIATLVEELERIAQVPPGSATVGVGIPGAVVPETGLVKNANSVWLIGQPLGLDLEERLTRQVRLANDANCFALSEAGDGAAVGGAVVFGVILGTGVGGGIVVNGQCLVGANLIAGEWGHNPLPWPQDDERPGPACYCGKAGCIESWLSGPGFQLDYEQRAGASLSARDINARAAAGEAHAVETLTRYHDRLARALASVINLLDPDIIVLGGGMSNTPNLAEDTTRLLPRWVFSDAVNTRIVRNMHGDSSGVRGAAWLWPLDARP
jgi:fructokinase